METDVWIHKTNIAMELAIEENNKKTNKTDKELVSEEYHNYLDIFNKEKAHQFFELRPWDHKDLSPSHSKITTLPWKNKSNWTNSSKKTLKKNTSDHLNYL
jgi:hypothetical protein